MPVRRRKDNGKWVFRTVVVLSNGKRKRIFGTPAINTKQAAQEAERAEIERVLNAAKGGATAQTREVPTLGVFAKEFMSTYALANNKPSEQRAKQNILDVWLLRDSEACRSTKSGCVRSRR